MKILLATGNRHKVSEITDILRSASPGRGHGDARASGGAPACSDADMELVSLKDFPRLPAVVEDGQTLEENAVKKAVLPAMALGLWTLADDTGLEVDALGGAPGVLSARFAGPACDFDANCRKLLARMRGVAAPERRALFRCVVALASPDGTVRIKEGRLEGEIVDAPAGTSGFGYDPVFFVSDLGKTLAELPSEEKNRISHRARALDAIRPLLKELW
ncbi:MAG: RdgB/HAM1 family non-canonical purine NTP pyrophosphatase [Elusimicrobiota bacterium]